MPGITGVVRDGILPGLYGYEAGQVAVGDMLAWFTDTLGVGAQGFTALEERAARLGPGETGLLALAWWNGNRTILADADLSGAIMGLTLNSTADHIYRALLESIAFGTRRIIDNFEEHGLTVDEVVAVGGIAERSPLIMQLLADTSGRVVQVPASSEIPARGSALFGALAAGHFEDIRAAAQAMRPPVGRTYRPDPRARATYEEAYAVYRKLYELLGRSHVELMHGLKRIRTAERRQP
jgi:L-ribulokinase